MSFYKEQRPKREKKCDTPTSTLKWAVHLTKFGSGTEWGGLKRETVEIKAILWLDFHKTKFTFSFFTNWMSFQNIPEPTFFVIFYVN